MKMERIKKLVGFIKYLENANVYKFKIDTFEDRLKLQKLVYIARYYGIDLGYNFSEYLRGPYSPELADDYYMLSEKLKDFKDIAATIDGESVEKFVKFIKDNSVDKLEGIATGLMFLSTLKRSNKDKETLKKEVATLVRSRKPFLANESDEIAEIVVSNFA